MHVTWAISITQPQNEAMYEDTNNRPVVPGGTRCALGQLHQHHLNHQYLFIRVQACLEEIPLKSYIPIKIVAVLC